MERKRECGAIREKQGEDWTQTPLCVDGLEGVLQSIVWPLPRWLFFRVELNFLQSKLTGLRVSQTLIPHPAEGNVFEIFVFHGVDGLETRNDHAPVKLYDLRSILKPLQSQFLIFF
jgi:hypothetical protein